MSSVGFNPNAGGQEIEKLREAFKSLNDVVRGIASAQANIELSNYGIAKDHLIAAQWHAKQAKKMISALGQSKREKQR